MSGQLIAKDSEQVEMAGRRRRRPRLRWFRVRVEAESGVFTGSLRLGPAGLRRLVDDERAYLALWNVASEGSEVVEDFVALHKGAIRSVVLLDEDPTASRAREQG